MEFVSPSVAKVRRSLIPGTPRRYLKVKTTEDASHNLSLYTHAVGETITLLEFQELGQARLKVLKKIESLKERFGSARDQYRKEYLKEITTLMPLAVLACSPDELAEERRKDTISHFILRLAFCQNQEQSEWFVRQETELFKMRFQLEPIGSIMQFLRLNKIDLEPVSESEKKAIAYDLMQSHVISGEVVMKTEFYKVPFNEVFDLFYSYKLYLKGGFAYITSNDLLALVAPRFRDNITASINHARVHLGYLQEDDRLLPLLKQMTKKGITYSAKLKDPNVADISPEMLVKTSFPLCMSTMHTQLRADHKLKHFARRQYGLFLKGIGMSMDSALAFFRQEFTKVMDGDKFSKEYSYNIRHMYGKEGSRIDQKPLACSTIILGSAPAAHDCHGCPFRHMEQFALVTKLQNLGLSQEQSRKIGMLSKSNQFDRACARYFEYTHKMPEGGLGSVITHPNEYYSLSRKILGGERALDVGLKTQKLVFETQEDGKLTQCESEKPGQEHQDDFYDDESFQMET
ncbi:eukaryotic and archaeal DNA primase, large subunit domain-containing protein [Ditylenchus destructor]|nr:eukaryotic and archaeal DNA primase, large subunit domain-containing protein [Ditylenchus destructor]